MTKPKPKTTIKKTRNAVVIVNEEAPALSTEVFTPIESLTARMNKLLMADALARLEQAKAAKDPDKMIACMDEINKLESE